MIFFQTTVDTIQILRFTYNKLAMYIKGITINKNVVCLVLEKNTLKLNVIFE